MASTMTTTTLSADLPAAFYDPILLKRLLPNLVYTRFGRT